MTAIVLHCSIAATQSALKFGSKIGRVTFEIPESELVAAVGLIALQETPLKLSIEVDETYKGQDNQSDSQAEAQSGGGRPWLRKRAAETDG